MRTLYAIIFLVLIFLSGTVSSAKIHDSRALEADPIQASQPIAPKLDGLGDHQFKDTTNNPESQLFFNQGLNLTYAFNHSEALRAFKEAVRLDQNNAMTYWGWALVLGPNLNLPMVPNVVPQAYEAIQKAVKRKHLVSEKRPILRRCQSATRQRQ